MLDLTGIYTLGIPIYPVWGPFTWSTGMPQQAMAVTRSLQP